MSNSKIYLIESENCLLKIGRAELVQDRVRTVRTHSPVLARLIATWPGAAPEEAELHRRFAAYRRHGEWFEITGSLAHFVAQLRGKNVPDIPEWEELRFNSRRAFGKRRGELSRALRKPRAQAVLAGEPVEPEAA
jgi:hypothetical protein